MALPVTRCGRLGRADVTGKTGVTPAGVAAAYGCIVMVAPWIGYDSYKYVAGTAYDGVAAAPCNCAGLSVRVSEMTTVAGNGDAVVGMLLDTEEMVVVRFLAAVPVTKRFPVGSDTVAAASRPAPACKPAADPTRDVGPNTLVPGT